MPAIAAACAPTGETTLSAVGQATIVAAQIAKTNYTAHHLFAIDSCLRQCHDHPLSLSAWRGAVALVSTYVAKRHLSTFYAGIRI
jgi:hypothetical protein